MPGEKWFFDKFPAWLVSMAWWDPLGPRWHLWPGPNTENNKLKQEPLSDLGKENTFPGLAWRQSILVFFDLSASAASEKEELGAWGGD